MCGLAGILGQDFLPKSGLYETLKRMGGTLSHRGPDSEGIYIDPKNVFGVVHRRLAIMDTSANGNQPMQTHSGRYTLAYNGEIYNFKPIRYELSSLGYDFKSNSDTEVLLNGIDYWGLEGMLARVKGMFAIALWDAAEQEVYLVVDRAGEKPIYYAQCEGALIFSSSLDTFSVIDKWKSEIDTQALCSYLKHGYVPHGQSILQGATKLAPGKIVNIKLTNSGVSFSEKTYWGIDGIATEDIDEISAKIAGSDPVEMLDALLGQAVSEQLVADVPIGVFLSGGVDSSVIAAIAQANTASPIKTFSIGFESAEFNETIFSKEVSNILGTDHREIFFSNQQLFDVLPKLSKIYDEPFSDISQLPTQLVSAVAREEVTVALTGDGGDELFGGYSRYLAATEAWKILQYIPTAVQTCSAKLCNFIPDSILDKTMHGTTAWYAKYGKTHKVSEKIKKSCALLPVETKEQLYQNLISVWRPSDNIIKLNDLVVDNVMTMHSQESYYQYMMEYDFMRYLPGDILTKVDRAAMYSSLETRIPFLDKNIIEFSKALPIEFKIREGCGKWIVKQVLKKYLPEHLIFRPKKGFSVPMQEWLMGDLSDSVKQSVCEPRPSLEDVIDYSVVSRKWKEHETGKRNWQYQLWNIFMLHTWLDQRGL